VTLLSPSAVGLHRLVFVAPASGWNLHSPSDAPESQTSLLSGSVIGIVLICPPALAPDARYHVKTTARAIYQHVIILNVDITTTQQNSTVMS